MATAVKLKTSGDYKNITKYLKRENKIQKIGKILEEYGKRGCNELAAATPVGPGEDGHTSDSWTFKIRLNPANQTATLEFWNEKSVSSPNYRKGRSVPVALLIQYGHGTRNGGYVQGRDFINPVLQPLFDDIAENVWKEVTSV